MEKVEDQKVIDALKTVFDPEIPVDLYELGLIYKCEVTPDNDVIIQMTLTTPNCPVADEMPKKVKEAVDAVPGVKMLQLILYGIHHGICHACPMLQD